MNNLWFVFHTEYTDLKHNNGKYCQVTRRCGPDETDDEVLLFGITFEDGEESTAFNEELELIGVGDLAPIKEWVHEMQVANGEA